MRHFTPFILIFILLFSSCSVHRNANIKGSETFIVEVKSEETRGMGEILTEVAKVAIQGLYLGGKYLAEQSSKSMINEYAQALSINDYYSYALVDRYERTYKIEKTYSNIVIQKYNDPKDSVKRAYFRNVIEEYEPELVGVEASRGAEEVNSSLFNTALNVTKQDKEAKLLSFFSNIAIESDPGNVGVSRLVLKELEVIFSKTKVFKDENLNVTINVELKGEWRDEGGILHKETLIDKKFNLKNLKYGMNNQIQKPLYSSWFYDLPPISSETAREEKMPFGIVYLTVKVIEYEGKKSKYVTQLNKVLEQNEKQIQNIKIPEIKLKKSRK